MLGLFHKFHIKNYKFSGREIVFVHVPFTIQNTDYKFVHDSCIVETENIHHLIIDYCLKLVERPQFNLILYSADREFKNIFKKGLQTSINLIICYNLKANMLSAAAAVVETEARNEKIYHLDEEQLVIANYFKNEIRPLLVNRMAAEFIDVYLNALQNSIVRRNDSVDQILLKYKINLNYIDSEYVKLAEHVRNLSAADITTIVHVILHNEINHSTSSNVFNLHKTEPRQQHALNLKKASNKNGNENATINETYKFYRNNDDLSSGNTYIIDFINFKVLKMEILEVKFKELIRRNFILYFKVHEMKLGIVYCTIAVSDVLYADFQSLRIDKNLIQFQIIDNIKDYTEIRDAVLFDGSIRTDNCWQSGNPVLLGFSVFSEETLTCPMKTFDLYSICCIDFINKIVELKLAISFKIRRVVCLKNFKFYYTLFTINTMYAVKILTELYPEFQEKECNRLGPDSTPLELLWSDRRCCTIIHHTYFKWLQDTGDIDNRDNQTVFRKNLCNYKYIEQTGNENLEPKTTSDAIVKYQVNIMIFIYISVHMINSIRFVFK